MADAAAAQAAQAIADAIAAAMANLPAAVGGGGGGGAGAAIVPPAFALSPAHAQPGIIDYSTTVGAKVYEKATAELECEKYDMKSSGLKLFLTRLKQRGATFAWGPITNINDSSGTSRDLYTQYGLLTHADVLVNVNTYSTANNRKGQNAAQMAECLWSSLTPEAVLELQKKKTDYIVGDHA